MEEQTIKRVTEKEILISFYSQWLQNKIQLEIELEIISKPIIFTKNLGEDVKDNTQQKAKCEAGIKMAEERLKIIEEKLK